jgi:hypothetical protein
MMRLSGFEEMREFDGEGLLWRKYLNHRGPQRIRERV